MLDVSKVLSFLKKNKVEISSEAEEAAKTEFNGQVLVTSDKVLADGMIAISKEFNDSKTDDLKSLKDKLRKKETDYNDLKEVLDAGGKTSQKKLDILMQENARLKPFAEAHLSEKKDLWKKTAEKIPEAMKQFFKFPEEGKELADEDVLSNMVKLKEYTDIGAVKLDGETVSPVSISRSAPGLGDKKLDTEAWRKLPATEKIAHSYKESAEKGK